jgi:hypothetical protein
VRESVGVRHERLLSVAISFVCVLVILAFLLLFEKKKIFIYLEKKKKKVRNRGNKFYFLNFISHGEIFEEWCRGG